MLGSILGKLHGVKKLGNGYQARCPAHDDDNPSLSVVVRDGKVLMHCHAGCSIEEVCTAMGVEQKELFVVANGNGRKKIVATYDYRDEKGLLLYQCVREDPKAFRYRRPSDNGGGGTNWIWNLAGVPLVPYRLPELAAADKAFPVFIVEGEKDVDNLTQLGLTATCNPMGAGKWRGEYADWLSGFHCALLPDNDEPGRRHAEQVAKSLIRKAEKVSVMELPGLPEKGDVSDWLAAGNTKEDLFALLDGAEIVQKDSTISSAIDTNIPDRFFLTTEGLFYQDKDPIFISSPIRVVANTCDRENTGWGRLVEFEDARGVTHSLNVPMSSLGGDGADVRARLMDAGLAIAPTSKARQMFLQYLLSAKTDRHVLSVNQLGWHEGAYVLPDEVICEDKSKKTIRLHNVDRAANKFKTNGNLEDWQRQIAAHCNGNSRLMFAVCVAFAAALVPFAEETNGGFHIHGHSSTGKTTALLVAGSVWGGDPRKGFLETWRATANGLEAVAELHNHSLLLLDEISQVNPHEVGEVIYSLSNGFGKSRMSKSISVRPKSEWTLTFLSSGEKTLEQVMHGISQRMFGGQEARFVNVQADAGAGHGIFEDLHGFESGNDLSKHLTSATRRCYGTPIRQFLNQVCQNESTVKTEIKEARQFFTGKLPHRDASGEVYRVMSRFALAAAGGALASEFGITGWDKAEVMGCLARVFNEWLEARGTTGSYDVAQGVRQVFSFIEQHGSSRFQSINDTLSRVLNRAGFKRENFEGQTEYLILPEMFEREICKGFQHVAVAKELERLGHLHRGSEKNYLSRKETLPELGRKRVYAITYDLPEDQIENAAAFQA